MCLRNVMDLGRSARLLRPITIALLCPLILGPVAGCGSSRPDPLAVVKDGGDDDDEPRPRFDRGRDADQAPAAKSGKSDAEVAGQGGDVPGAATAGTAPFDLTFLPVDTQMVVVAECADIIRSSLVRALTANQHGAFDPLVNDFGLRFGDIEILRIGIRDLKAIPVPTRESLAAGLGGISLMGLALNPDISSTIVIQTRDRVDESPLRKAGEEIRVGDKRYFRLRSNTFNSTCAFISGFRTLVLADESTILSIVESKARPPQPAATFSFARKADLVIAVAPESREQMQRWLPALDMFSSASAGEITGDSDLPTADSQVGDLPSIQPDPTTASSTVAGSVDGAQDTVPTELSNAAAENSEIAADAQAPIKGNGESIEQAGNESPTNESQLATFDGQVTGAAVMVNLEGGVAVSISLNCDTPEAAASVAAKLDELAAQVQSATTEQGDDVPGGIRELVESISTTTLQSVAAVTMAVTSERQADIVALPGLMLGDDAAEGAMVTSTTAVLEPPSAFAEQILREGIPPLSASTSHPGMELRGLARWAPTLSGVEAPRELELGVVAFGGPAMTSVALGRFQLEDAEVNRLSPLKWLGTSVGYDELGMSPIDGFVPVDHSSDTSVHPKNGVLAVFTVVPPSEPATHLRHFQGRFLMRYYTISNDIIVERLRDAIVKNDTPSELQQAGIEFDLTSLADRETLEVFYPESTRIGAVQLVQEDGMPIENVKATSTSSQGKVLRTLTTGETLPQNVALRITINSELAEVEVPFEFANLPIPNVGTLTDMQRALLVWTEAESDSGLPDGLQVEAQARWDNPDATTGLFSAADVAVEKRPAKTFVASDSDDDDRRRNANHGRSAYRSERPLRVLVDLTGPLAEQADAMGQAHVTSIETDFHSELNFEGAYFRHQDASEGIVSASSTSRMVSNGPPGGLRIAYHFTPPLEPIHELARFNGSIRLRISQDRVVTEIPRLQERAGNRVTNRELSRLGLALVAKVESNRVLVRLLEGEDQQISELIAVDTYGDPVPGVVVAVDEAAQRAERRRVHTLTFSNGVPTGVGLRVAANSGVQVVDVPFRFAKLPVPPAPGFPGL